MKCTEFRGFILNHDSLCVKNNIPQTISDKELIECLYKQYEEDIVYMLEGQFAFAVNDENDFLIVRDSIGFKSIYYSFVDGKLCYNTNLKRLVDGLQTKPSLCKNAIYQYLSFAALPEDITWFEGVYKLEPGTYLSLKNGVKKKVTYYRASDYLNKCAEEDNVIEKLDELLRHDFSLLSQYTLALSGGVDSCLLAAVGQFLKKEFSTASVCINGKKSEDLKRIEGISHLLSPVSMKIVNCEVSRKTISDLAHRISMKMYEPMQIMDMVLLKGLFDSHSNEFTVSGEGADELGGYKEYIKANMLNSILKTRRNTRSYTKFYKGNCIVDKHIVGVDEETKKDIWISDPCECSYEYIHSLYSDIDDSLTDSFYRKLQHVDVCFRLPEYLLHRIDIISSMSEKKIVFPFLSKPLFEYCLCLNKDNMINGDVVKFSFKKILNNYFPSDDWYKNKVGFGDELNEYIDNVLLQNFLSEIKCNSKHPLFQYINREKITDILTSNTKLIWVFYSLGVFLETLT